jgi:hypothetical protein
LLTEVIRKQHKGWGQDQGQGRFSTPHVSGTGQQTTSIQSPVLLSVCYTGPWQHYRKVNILIRVQEGKQQDAIMKKKKRNENSSSMFPSCDGD